MEIHRHISAYLESKSRTYDTGEFMYSSYTSPNTMFNISNSLPEKMLCLSPSALKVYLRTLSMLKRNADPILACSVHVTYSKYKDLISPRAYVRARKELLKQNLIEFLPNNDLILVNLEFANKLYKPKVDI